MVLDVIPPSGFLVTMMEELPEELVVRAEKYKWLRAAIRALPAGKVLKVTVPSIRDLRSARGVVYTYSRMAKMGVKTATDTANLSFYVTKREEQLR